MIYIFKKPLRHAFCLFAFVTACNLTVAASNSSAEEGRLSEYEVKVAFIYNFLKFVEWGNDVPGDPSGTIALCVLGEDPFGNALNAVEGKTLKGIKFTVQYVDDVHDVACRALFISASEKERISRIVKMLEGSSILTIGDTEGFGEKGVMINFIIRDNKVRFEINPEAARRAGLTISSKLLSLATIVHSRGQ